MGDVCQQCGREFERIGQHWSISRDCEYSSLSQKQKEITTGLLMGDGRIKTCNKNPRIDSEMISPNYLQYVDEEFDIFGNGVSLKKTAEESAKQCRDRGFHPDADEENYSDIYHWCSMGHPELKPFAEWYSSGKKVWPAGIELTPTVLKHWYCGDGCFDNRDGSRRIKIAMSNELNNTDKVDAMFGNVCLPSPSNYNTSERKDGSVRCDAQFTVDQSEELWEYMGDPLPDFAYKWPEAYR